jgi:SNF2 family DNA or RNA helicase
MGDLEEYINLPGYEDIVIPVQLTSRELSAHDMICHSNDNALARLTKCQQLTSGIEFQSSKRLACELLVKELLDDDEKIVLFTKYDAEFEYFMDKYSEICVGINGKTKDRETPVYEFQNNPSIKIFIGNIQTAGMGITLTSANRCIIYSETFVWGDADQARARIYRIGQTEFCTYYHLLARDTVDEMIFKSNINKTDLIQDFKKKFGGN